MSFPQGLFDAGATAEGWWDPDVHGGAAAWFDADADTSDRSGSGSLNTSATLSATGQKTGAGTGAIATAVGPSATGSTARSGAAKLSTSAAPSVAGMAGRRGTAEIT